MSFLTSTWVSHQSGKHNFGSRRDLTTTSPEISQMFGDDGRYGLKLFLKAKSNGNELTAIPRNRFLLFDFWHNTKSHGRIFLSE